MVMTSVNMTTKDRIELLVSAYQHSVVLTLQAECHWKSHRFLVNNNERKSWENFLSNLTRLLIEESCFDSRQIKKKNLSPLRNVHTGPAFYPVSYSMDTGEFFLGYRAEGT